MTYTIKVTAEDIAMGKPKHGGLCPVALAVRRYLPAVPIVVLSKCIQYDADEIEVELPGRVQAFIRNFDESKPVKPFTFRLSCPLLPI